MAIDINPKLSEHLQKAYYLWFTTVREDGQPQPTPVWFVQENNTILLYSKPDAQKVSNIRHNGKVALSYTGDNEANTYFVIMGEAVIDGDVPLPSKNTAYFQKYEKGFGDIGMTPESFDQTYSLAIRITPTRVR